MLQQLVTTTFTNFGCEALDQLRDSQSHKCSLGLAYISRIRILNSKFYDINSIQDISN